jgi:hypothetical protein
MSQLLKVRTITQVIDSRIAQFSSGIKELPVVTPTRKVYSGSKAPSKLKPLDHAPGFKGKKEDPRTAKSQLSPLPKARPSLRSTTISVRKSDSMQESPQLEKALNTTSVSTLQTEETKGERVMEHWVVLMEAVLEQGRAPLSLTPAYQSMRKCLLRLKYAVRVIERKQVDYKRKMKALVTIQAWVRGTKQQRRFVTMRYAAYQIQRYWRQVWQHKAALQRVKRAAKLLIAWWR